MNDAPGFYQNSGSNYSTFFMIYHVFLSEHAKIGLNFVTNAFNSHINKLQDQEKLNQT